MIVKPYKLGWYRVIEDWNNDGSIDMSIHDGRDDTIVEIHCETFEAHNQVFEHLAKSRELGTPEKIKQLLAA